MSASRLYLMHLGELDEVRRWMSLLCDGVAADRVRGYRDGEGRRRRRPKEGRKAVDMRMRGGTLDEGGTWLDIYIL